MIKLLIFHISLKLKGMTTYEYILRNLNKVRPARKGINNHQHGFSSEARPGGEPRHPGNQDDSREDFSDGHPGQGHDVNLRFPESGMRRHREENLDVPPGRLHDFDPTNQEVSKTQLKDSGRYEFPQRMDSRRSIIAQADQIKQLAPKRRSHDFTEDLSQDEKLESLKNLSFLQLQQVFKTIEMDDFKNDHKNSAANVGHDLTQSKMTNIEMEKSALKQSRSEGDFSRLCERQTSRGGLKPASQVSPLSQVNVQSLASAKAVSQPISTFLFPIPTEMEVPKTTIGGQPNAAPSTPNQISRRETRTYKPETAAVGDG